MLDIMAGMFQKDLLVGYLLVTTHLALYSFSCRQAQTLGISAGMEQRDSSVRARRHPGIGLCIACFTGDFAPRAIYLLSCCPAQMLSIFAGMDQTDSSVAKWWPRSLLATEVACFYWFCWWMQFALCSLRCRQARRQVDSYVVWGFAGDDAFCAMFPSFVLRPRCLHLGR